MKNLLCILIILIFGHSAYGSDKTIILAKGVNFHIEVESINKSEFQNSALSVLDDILLIDNKPVFGSFLRIPSEKVKSAYISINNKIINLDVSYMYDPNLFMLDEKSFKVLTKGDLYVIDARFSDGAGTYVAQWIINGNSSTRMLISESENIVIGLMYGDVEKKEK